MKAYHRRTNCQDEWAQHPGPKTPQAAFQLKHNPGYTPSNTYYDRKIMELAEIVEHCRDLPKGSYSSAMLGMVRFRHLTHETALAISENHVRILRGTRGSHAQNTPGASHVCDEVLAI